MATLARGGLTLFVGAAALVAVVTALLNLDTAVAFLTPVLVVAARRRHTAEEPFVYLAVFMANGASLLLPGSNLTNLIVLGGLHRSGATFVGRMALPWLVSVIAVAFVVWLRWHRSLGRAGAAAEERGRLHKGVGLLAVVVAVVAVVALPPQWAAGVVVLCGAAALALGAGRHGGLPALTRAERAVNLPVLAGLFCVAADLGTLGRVWSWPHHLVAHASSGATAVAGAVTSVVVNNLPAASLLAARPPAHPYALLVGLDLGPNLAVTGALSAVLWLQVSHQAGASASPLRYSRVGIVVTAVSMAAALAVLTATG